MKAAALFAALALAPAKDGVQSITPECGATHCQITVEQMQGVRAFQAFAVTTIRAQAAEIQQLRRDCGIRGT